MFSRLKKKKDLKRKQNTEYAKVLLSVTTTSNISYLEKISIISKYTNFSSASSKWSENESFSKQCFLPVCTVLSAFHKLTQLTTIQ